jgi:hypothetical protein
VVSKTFLLKLGNLIADWVKGWDVSHFINHQSVNDDLSTLVFNENCSYCFMKIVFIVHCRVTMLLHPVLDANVPSSGGLFHAALEYTFTYYGY